MKLFQKLLPDPFDTLHILGFAAIVWGVWQLNHAAAWITAGVGGVLYSTLASAGRRHREP